MVPNFSIIALICVSDPFRPCLRHVIFTAALLGTFNLQPPSFGRSDLLPTFATHTYLKARFSIQNTELGLYIGSNYMPFYSINWHIL